jgi:hypothetical protein
VKYLTDHIENIDNIKQSIFFESNNNFCYEILKSSIDIEKCISLIEDCGWFSYEKFDNKFSGYYGIGLTGFENSDDIEIDSLKIYQDISRNPTEKETINWQQMSTRTKNVKGYIEDFFNNLKFPPQRARFSRIDPGKSIALHRDDFMENMTRVHWPIHSLPGNVFFNYDDTTKKINRYFLKPGHCYAINTNLLHGIVNHSSEPRIHLIINFNISFEEMKQHIEGGILNEKI